MGCKIGAKGQQLKPIIPRKSQATTKTKQFYYINKERKPKGQGAKRQEFQYYLFIIYLCVRETLNEDKEKKYMII